MVIFPVGHSWGLFLADLAQAWASESFSCEHTPQYSDFQLWYQKMDSTGELESMMEYWTEQLSGVQQLVYSNNQRGAGQLAHNGGRAKISMSQSVAEGLESTGRSKGATMFSVFLALWAATLCRYYGGQHIVITAPYHGREMRDSEGIIGCFINRLPYCVQVPDRVSARALVGSVSRVAMNVMSNAVVPLGCMVERLGLGSATQLDKLDICRIRLAWQELGGAGAADGGIPTTLGGAKVCQQPLHGPQLKVNYDLRLIAGPDGAGQINGALWFNLEMFTQSTADALMEKLGSIATLAAERPDEELC